MLRVRLLLLWRKDIIWKVLWRRSRRIRRLRVRKREGAAIVTSRRIVRHCGSQLREQRHSHTKMVGPKQTTCATRAQTDTRVALLCLAVEYDDRGEEMTDSVLPSHTYTLWLIL